MSNNYVYNPDTDPSYNEQEECWEGKRHELKKEGEYGALIDRPPYDVEEGARIRVWNYGKVVNDTFIASIVYEGVSPRGDEYVKVRLVDTAKLPSGGQRGSAPKGRPPSGGQKPPPPAPSGQADFPASVEITAMLEELQRTADKQQSTLDQILYHLTMKED